MDPAVLATDEVILAYSFWKSPTLGNVLVLVVGTSLGPNSLGPGADLSETQRTLLSEVGAVLVDKSDRHRVGVSQLGEVGEVLGRRVRVAGFVEGISSVTGPYVLCSLQTAREILSMASHQTTFVVGKCRDRVLVPEVVARSQNWQGVTVSSSAGFSARTQWYWLRTTKAGLAVAFVAGLSLLIGTLVTSQTLYAATLASVKELAILRALGAPRWRIRLYVLEHSFVVGAVGTILGLPVSVALVSGAAAVGVNAVLPTWLVLGSAGVILVMALLAGLVALRVLRLTEPGELLR
jgi:putative ABC transport system permease protein